MDENLYRGRKVCSVKRRVNGKGEKATRRSQAGVEMAGARRCARPSTREQLSQMLSVSLLTHPAATSALLEVFLLVTTCQGWPVPWIWGHSPHSPLSGAQVSICCMFPVSTSCSHQEPSQAYALNAWLHQPTPPGERHVTQSHHVGWCLLCPWVISVSA